MTALPAASAFTGGAVTQGAFKTAVTDMREFIAEMLGTTGGGVSNVPLTLTISSANPALKITQTGAGNAILVEDSTSTDATPWAVDASGIVISGHTAAVTVGPVASMRNQFHGISQAASSLQAAHWGSGTGSAKFTFGKARGDTIGTQSVITSGDDLGVLDFYGYAGATGGWVQAAGVEAVNTGTVSDALTGVGAHLRFLTRLTGGSLTERLRISAEGNIGIGTSTFGTNAAGVLGIANAGTVPSTSPANMIQLYAKDSSAGAANSTLALRTEQAVEAIGTFTPSHKLRVWLNEVEYHVQLDAV